VTRAARERGFAVVRATRNGSSFDTRVGLTPIPLWWVQLLCAVPVFLVGLLLLVRAPEWHLARRYFVTFFCLGVLDASFDWKTSPFRGTWLEVTLAHVLQVVTGTLLVWNAQEFTRSARPVPLLHRALAIGVGVGAALLFLVRFYLPHSLGPDAAIAIGSTLYASAVYVLGFTRAYRRSDPLERRQIRWVILGLYVASVGVPVAIVSSYMGLGWKTVSRVLGSLDALWTPAGILISVIGYRWLDIDRLISAAASYTLLGLAVIGASLAAIPALSRATAPVLGVDAASLQWLLTLGLVVAAIPAHSFLWPRIDRRMFAERHQRMLGFARLLDEIGDYASVPELVRMAGERIDALLEPESIAVYARTDAHLVPVFTRGRANSAPGFEAGSPLVRALEQRGRPLWANAPELDAFDRAALETLGVELVVPIRGRDELVAFACLGRKRSGDIYTPQEIAHLGAVANRCSDVLLRLMPQQPAEAARQVFHREGDFWTIASHGKQIRLRDMRGLHHLATLLREPGREFAASDLVNLASGTPLGPSHEDPALRVVNGLGDTGEWLDARARAAYRERLREIETERAEAERHGDLGRLERTSEEREALLAELVAAARGRRAASHAERARVSVTKAIRSALDRISEGHPELGAHLSATVRRGHLCTYVPDPWVPSDWEI
jgi:GAF domain-containing protein